MSDIDRIKEKLAKLLRLGENNAATEGEIQAALNLATQMMAKHQLTRDDIDMSAADPVARVALGRHFAFAKGAAFTSWEQQLVHFVTGFIGTADAYHTRPMPVRRNGIADFFGGQTEGEPRMAAAVAFYGSDEDARCAAAMYEELRDAIATMAILRWGGWARGDGNAYAWGFVEGLLAANRKAKLELKATDATTSALILKSEAMQLAIVSKGRDWLATTHGVKLKATSARKVSFRGDNAATAMGEGVRDGRNYNPTRPASRTRLG